VWGGGGKSAYLSIIVIFTALVKKSPDEHTCCFGVTKGDRPGCRTLLVEMGRWRALRVVGTTLGFGWKVLEVGAAGWKSLGVVGAANRSSDDWDSAGHCCFVLSEAIQVLLTTRRRHKM
jgi:hypothetical protein